MTTADPPTPAFDLQAEVGAYLGEHLALDREVEALNRRRNQLRARARDLAARFIGSGIPSVVVLGWVVWPSEDGQGFHRRRAPVGTSGDGRDA